MSGKLETLTKHRDTLLLAEVGALLHDLGKFCDLHMESGSEGGSGKWSNDHAYKTVVSDPNTVIQFSAQAQNVNKPDVLNNVLNAGSPKIADFISNQLRETLEHAKIKTFGDEYTLAELIMLGAPGFAVHKNRAKLLDSKDAWLPALLGVCHHEAHHDKQEPAKGEGRQQFPHIFVSTAFGYEDTHIPIGKGQEGLNARLHSLAFSLPDLCNRDTVKRIREEFAHGLGDTRRPINEITLDDWSFTVASLFKSALATALISSQKRKIRKWLSWRDKVMDHDFHWRLLRVNFDVLGLYTKAIKIAYLLAYQIAVEDACEAVRKLVEEEYPLGNEVYRDTTGIYFTFPDIELPAELEREIRRRVEEVEPELAPHIHVEAGEGKDAGEQLKNLLAGWRRQARYELAKPMTVENLSPCWQDKWESLPGGRWEICPICRLRPMKEGNEACEHCWERRRSRIGAWKQDPTSTIWMDEIADGNGRVALIVGKFGLDDWLSGELVRTLLVKAAECDPNRCEPKNPSPARLRRVWETTQRFWEKTVVDGLLEKLSDRHRWELFSNSIPDVSEEIVCDGTLGGRPISVVRVGDRFLTVSYLSEKPSPGHLEVWWERGIKKKRLSSEINKVSEPDQEGPGFRNYRPYLPLVSSPDRFLALVPADSALDVVDGIRKKYEEQFGKVQNRLPIFLGLVFFQRKMPLAAVMDAGRRMLEQVGLEEEGGWKVRDKKNGGSLVELALADGGRETRQKIPVKMGDGVTEDRWYPYFFFEGEPGQRKRCFKHDNSWLVHVEDLQEGDSVRVSPSRFSYLYLEHAERRFRFDPGRDAMLLDELPRLREMWRKLLKTPGMTTAKLQGLRTLFETKQQLWRVDEEGVPNVAEAREAFERLAETALKREGISDISADDVLSGRFRRCLELHLHVLRKRVEEVKRG
jgi:hypothetical protein